MVEKYLESLEWGNELAFQLRKKLSDDPELIDWFESELEPEYHIWIESEAEGFPVSKEQVFEWFYNTLKLIGWTMEMCSDNSVYFSDNRR